LGEYSAFRRRVSGMEPFPGLTHKLVWSKAAKMGPKTIRRIAAESSSCPSALRGKKTLFISVPLCALGGKKNPVYPVNPV
jgi:hypothetical protein